MTTDHTTGEPLFDPDADAAPTTHMAGPSEETSRLISQHLAEREAQGEEPYWPDWDE
jgi:hypothetical protein